MIECLMMKNKLSQGTDEDQLIAGTVQHGWYGEVPALDFITGDALATAVGLASGMTHHSTAGWLKFALGGKVLYVAKRPFRSSISWDQLDAIGIVFGSKTVVIAGKTYKVRLLKGRNDGLETYIGTGFDLPASHGSEWNRLMYHVSGKPFGDVSNKLTSEGIVEGDWVKLLESELLTHLNFGYGSCSWCQETVGPNKLAIGYGGVSRFGPLPANRNDSIVGWRPCLELIG